MELNKYILTEALRIDVCEEYAKIIPLATSTDDLMKMYVSPKGIEFCLTNNFPSNADLLDSASDIINQYGVYIDQSIRLSDRGFVVLLGSCTGEVKCDGFSVTQIFVKHKTNVIIKVTDNAFTAIDCFDQSNTHVEVSESAKVIINVYTGAKISTNKVKGEERIKIVYKLKSGY